MLSIADSLDSLTKASLKHREFYLTVSEGLRVKL